MNQKLVKTKAGENATQIYNPVSENETRNRRHAQKYGVPLLDALG